MESPNDRPLFDDHEDSSELQHEVVAPRRSMVGLVASVVAVVGLGYLVVNGGQSRPDEDERGLPATTSSTTTPPATGDTTPPTASRSIERTANGEARSPLSPPQIAGSLSGGATYRVEERIPGILCVEFEEPASTTTPAHDLPADTCHHELVTASGPAVFDGVLIFGYLAPGADSVTLRYRSGNVGNDGLRVEKDARFFALPVNGDDGYRIQYRDANLAITDEIPMVSLRGGPSQEAADAQRDSVPAEIASLAFNLRVDPIEEWTSLAEGPYVWSRLAERSIDDHWSEVLLLDASGTEIIRSTPLPGVRLTARLDLEDAVYLLGRQVTTPYQLAVDRGEIAFPVVVARIDRTTGASLVRIFPMAPGSGEAIEPELTQPGWQLGPPLPAVEPARISATDRFLQIEVVADNGGEPSDSILLDRDNLEPISRSADR